MTALSGRISCVRVVRKRLRDRIVGLDDISRLSGLGYSTLLISRRFISFSSVVSFHSIRPSVGAVLLISDPLGRARGEVYGTREVIPFCGRGSESRFGRLVLRR